MKDNRKGKYQPGPGGIKCRCCRIGSTTEHKMKLRRFIRRQDKQNLIQEID